MNRVLLICIALGVLLMNSCIVAKKRIYVKDMLIDTAYQTTPRDLLKLQTGDRLSIVVRAKVAELAAPFNAEVFSTPVTNSTALTGIEPMKKVQKDYLVSEQGTIDFPILGTLQVEGLDLEQVKSLIQGQIIASQMIADPVVQVELLNMRINVMGEVTMPKLVEVPDGRITVFDAITEARGLTVNGAPNKVMVIREEKGDRKIYALDLESKEIFDSPGYHLQQNDIVYVEPISGKFTPREDMTFRYISLGTGLISLILSILILSK